MEKYHIKPKAPGVPRRLKVDYEGELNEAQLRAVETLEGPLLVIAGAGSGKTRTLVYRVARLVEEGVEPERILLLTFTRKAAREMLRRAEKLLDERCGKVSGGTFHSFANLVLRRYAPFVGFESNFTIIDRGDGEDIINLIRSELGLHRRGRRFPQKKAILDVISKSINKGITLGEALVEEYPQFKDDLPYIEKIAQEYQRRKKEKSIMDYDDLLVYLKKLLDENDEVRRKLSSYYRYIMIDEYQDTNKLQAEIARLLASEHGNIMAVGDDSQSIYSFRGANFRNIMDFPKIFPNTKVITLEENYRSTQPILDLTNEIIRHAKEKYSKTLFTRRQGGAKPIYIEAKTENMQSRFVVQRVLELREEGVPLGDIAVLFRSGWHSNDLEIELARANIPFVKWGGFKFVETAHVKDVLAHLRVVSNPRDSFSWQRVLLLVEGVGPKAALELIAEIVDGRGGYQVLRSEKYAKKRYGDGIARLHDVLLEMSRPGMHPGDQIRALIDYYKPIVERKYDDFPKRLGDLDSLARIAERYQSTESFLADLALEPLELTEVGVLPEEEREEKLVLSTIHSAKGLEWHTVFIIFLVDGYLPSAYSLSSEEELEEERRLLYVAATRAKENLYLIKPGLEYPGRSYFDYTYYGFTKCSRFLTEGDALTKYVEWWTLVEDDS